MYFAQGIPHGLLGIAIPAWLASQGVTAAAIASYLAVVILPWVFKLVTGPLPANAQAAKHVGLFGHSVDYLPASSRITFDRFECTARKLGP